MSAAVSVSMEELRQQANRLKFRDAALERTFNSERILNGITRSRVMLVLGMVVLGGLGYLGSRSAAALRSPFLEVDLRLRFFGVVPVWLVMFLSTFLPGHEKRAGWVNATGTMVVCWFVALGLWYRAGYFPADKLSGNLTTNLTMVLVPAAVILPMRFREIALAVVAGAGGPLLFCFRTLPPERIPDLQVALGNLIGFGLVIVALSWYREAAERLMFAQREHMRGLNAELARLNAEKNEFMAIASHDLRAPLSSVQGLAGQLQDGKFSQPAEQRQVHAAIVGLAGRMLGLVDDYLGAHAAESGTLPLRLEPLDLQAVITQAGDRHAPVAETKAQRVAVAAGPVVRVSADASLLAQVVDNFVSNALKFSPPGAIVRLGVAVAKDGSVARLEVNDEGPGIAAEAQVNLFRKFSRTGVRPTGGETSFGLGLAVTKRLAESMGGHVGCDSPVNTGGGGARFWIELPAVA